MSLLAITREGFPFSSYITEILRAEGLDFDHMSDWGARCLKVEVDRLPCRTLIVGRTRLDTDECALLADFVERGGALLLLGPPSNHLARRLGFDTKDAFYGGYITIEDGPLGTGICHEALQWHGEGVSLRTAEGAKYETVVRYTSDTESDRGSAVVAGRCGRGRVVCYGYDLAKAVVLLRQGRKDQGSLGPHPDPDGDEKYKPADLFFDFCDACNYHIPQADEQQKLLVNCLHWLSEVDQPLPRVWYFPRRAKAISLLTGDSDNMSMEHLDTVIDAVEDGGGAFTTYIMQQEVVSPEDEVRLRARGHSFGPHAWAGTGMPDPKTLRAALEADTQSFRARYGYSPLTYRGHSLIWVGWVEMAEILRDLGFRMDCNFVGYGYMNGSGRPMKFMTEDGTLLDVYEQGTQWEDDVNLMGKLGSPKMTMNEIVQKTRAFIRESLDFHTAVTYNFHPIGIESYKTFPWIRTVVEENTACGIPMIGMDAWLKFNDARRSITLTSKDFKDGVLRFDFASSQSVQGLTILLPQRHGRMRLRALGVDGRQRPVDSWEAHGIEYAPLDLDMNAGTMSSVTATYA